MIGKTFYSKKHVADIVKLLFAEWISPNTMPWPSLIASLILSLCKYWIIGWWDYIWEPWYHFLETEYWRMIIWIVEKPWMSISYCKIGQLPHDYSLQYHVIYYVIDMDSCQGNVNTVCLLFGQGKSFS